jgi:hypothetical protein
MRLVSIATKAYQKPPRLPAAISLVPKCVLKLDKELVRIELPAVLQLPHIVVVDDEQVPDRAKRPPQLRIAPNRLRLVSYCQQLLI